MTNKPLKSVQGSRTYVIEPSSPEIGAYLWIYEEGRDIADHLQDSIEDCIEFAFEDFAVPRDSWVEKSDV